MGQGLAAQAAWGRTVAYGVWAAWGPAVLTFL